MNLNFKKKLQESTIARSSRILSKSDKRKVLGVIILQISFGLLDLVGVAVIGVIGALAITGVQAKDPGNRVQSLLTFLQLDGYSLQVQATVLGLTAACLLIGKTIFSIIFTRRTIFFLSRRGARLSGELVSKLFSQSLLTVQSKSMNEMLYSVTGGVDIITVGVLGTVVALIADSSLLLVMAAGLVIVDPLIAVSTFFTFAAIGLLLYKFMHLKARDLGIKRSQIQINTGERVLEVIRSYRETVVRNRREYYSRVIANQRLELADVAAEMSFMPNISKYVIEVTVVIGSLTISALQFRSQEASHAIAVLSIFLAASTRIAPAVLRLQQGAISIRGSLGAAQPTLDLIEDLANAEKLKPTVDQIDFVHEGFEPNVILENLCLTYPEKVLPAVNNVSLNVFSGQITAFVGPSGAGKTSIIDVLLGVLPADSGTVKISGEEPLIAISKWPGAISYVPQDVMISNGTIRENVCMGFPASEAKDENVWEALRIAQLEEFVVSLPNGLDAQVGDRGTKISGGQRQRLGIARAMFTKPALLVLDEATSSLDGETEALLSEAIQNMRGSVTVIMIAHRLSTIRHSDVVFYLQEGKLLAHGTFDQVRDKIPDFDKQASLMGL